MMKKKNLVVLENGTGGKCIIESRTCSFKEVLHGEMSLNSLRHRKNIIGSYPLVSIYIQMVAMTGESLSIVFR